MNVNENGPKGRSYQRKYNVNLDLTDINYGNI